MTKFRRTERRSLYARQWPCVWGQFASWLLLLLIAGNPGDGQTGTSSGFGLRTILLRHRTSASDKQKEENVECCRYTRKAPRPYPNPLRNSDEQPGRDHNLRCAALRGNNPQ